MRFAGIDVGKRSHSVGIVDAQLKRLGGIRVFKAIEADFERLVRRLGEPGDLLVVMEATGHYWRNLFRFLVKRSYAVAVVNPIGPAHFAKVELRRAKTDTTDAWSLARYAARMRPEPGVEVDEVLQRVRSLGRLRDRFVRDLNARESQLHKEMDLAFPEVTNVLRKLIKHRSTRILSRYPTAQLMAKARVYDLERLRYGRQGKGKVGREVAKQLVELAKTSVGYQDPEYARVAVPALCASIDSLRAQIAELDALIDALVDDLELGRLLTSVPGIAATTAARLLGELGDPGRFKSGRALASYVGVVPATSHSGERRPQTAGICKIGNERLRRALWMSTQVAAHGASPWLTAFYEKLVARGKKPKVAMIAVMNKLLRAIWRVCRDRRPFERRTPVASEG